MEHNYFLLGKWLLHIYVIFILVVLHVLHKAIFCKRIDIFESKKIVMASSEKFEMVKKWIKTCKLSTFSQRNQSPKTIKGEHIYVCIDRHIFDNNFENVNFGCLKEM